MFNCISISHSQGYVERETTHIGSLTVREFLYYSALLQLPGFFCRKKSVVEDAILAMSLGDYANKLIGGHCYMKGLARGERRRVSIARELVMRPHVLFIDESLYHLDRFVQRYHDYIPFYSIYNRLSCTSLIFFPAVMYHSVSFLHQ